jgi:hypothetical protein
MRLNNSFVLPFSGADPEEVSGRWLRQTQGTGKGAKALVAIVKRSPPVLPIPIFFGLSGF